MGRKMIILLIIAIILFTGMQGAVSRPQYLTVFEQTYLLEKLQGIRMEWIDSLKSSYK